MKQWKFYVASLLVLSFIQTTTAQVPKWYQCFRTEAPPLIDGNLHDDAWTTAPWSDAFIDIHGDEFPAPEYETRFKMLWDSSFLYVAVWMEEPHLRASLRQRDTVVFFDNDFEMFIDGDGDHSNYGEIEVNAYNTIWDLMVSEPYDNEARAFNAWDLREMQSEIGIYGTLNNPSDRDSGWVVEWALPMKDLYALYSRDTVPVPQTGEYWKVNFSRVQWPLEIINNRYRVPASTSDIGRESNWTWSPQNEVNMHWPEQWGIVVFSDPSEPLENLPDDIIYRESVRIELMNIYRKCFEFLDSYDKSPDSIDAFIEGLNFNTINTAKISYFRSPSGFDIYYPLSETVIIRISDDRRCIFIDEEEDD